MVLEHETAAIDLSRHQGYEFRAVTASILRGWARVELGAIDEGLLELRTGIDGYVASGAEINLPYFIGLLADARLRAGQLAGCVQTVDTALAAIVTSSFCYEAELHRLGGVARIRMGEEAKGRKCLRRALDVARSQKALSLELRAVTDIARYAGMRRKEVVPTPYFSDVRSRLKEASKTPDIVEADLILGRS
jgi:predicted ATPase